MEDSDLELMETCFVESGLSFLIFVVVMGDDQILLVEPLETSLFAALMLKLLRPI